MSELKSSQLDLMGYIAFQVSLLSFCQNYGYAGPVYFYGKEYGLPDEFLFIDQYFYLELSSICHSKSGLFC